MNDPIYEIPVTPEPVDGWHPGRPGRAVPDAFAPDTYAPDALAPEAAAPAPSAPQTWPQPAAPAPQYVAPAPQYYAPSSAVQAASEPSERAYRDPSAAQPAAFETLVPRYSTGEGDDMNETGAYPRDLLAGAIPPTGAPIPATAPAPTQAPPHSGSTAAPNRAPALAQPFDANAYAAPTLAAPTGAPTLSAPIELEEHARLHADRDLIEALVQVVQQKASDLHVTVAAPPMLRVNGALRSAVEGAVPWDREKVSSALHSLLTPDQAARFEEELELDFAYGLAAQARFRVNIYQQRGSLGAAFRLIPTEIKQLKDLGVPDTVGKFAGLPRGLVLVTGPTGSGKSTTLAALIDLVNSTRADHIVTVEDPIEFIHKHKLSIVNQREVGADTHSFANALKHVLRQDPDVILIGELRDLETISVALTAAETGHLVFATLHTQDAPQSIDR
ncbi:MAG TPA: PilT/PilU family type 4a pilus ATPase, partial [Humibacter sp.]|nr:PilT/PilU family type 4a pilus ATPase [Humibacter sp.]